VTLSDRIGAGTAGDHGSLGRWLHRLTGRSPSEREVLSLFSGFETIAVHEPRRTAREISALRYRNRALTAIVARRGLHALTPLADPAGTECLEVFRRPRRPTILLTWHLGPIFGLGAALAYRNIPVLAIRAGPFYEPVGRMDLAFTQGGPVARARAVGQALKSLEEGGLVLLAAEGPDGACTEAVPCLGRLIALARGPFGLARLTGADVFPCVPRWNNQGRIDVYTGEPLTPPGCDGDKTRFESSYAAAAARWLQSYLLASPQELWLYTLRWLLSARVAPSSH
jgi:lauroyl/myristoyl acyltransferase